MLSNEEKRAALPKVRERRRYTGSEGIKNVEVAMSRLDELKKFYR